MAEFPVILKSLRTDRHLSRKDLATKLGVSTNTVYLWENGKIEPTLSSIKGIADFFNVTPSFLMGYEENNEHEEKNISDANILFLKEIYGDVSIVSKDPTDSSSYYYCFRDGEERIIISQDGMSNIRKMISNLYPSVVNFFKMTGSEADYNDIYNYYDSVIKQAYSYGFQYLEQDNQATLKDNDGQWIIQTLPFQNNTFTVMKEQED